MFDVTTIGGKYCLEKILYLAVRVEVCEVILVLVIADVRSLARECTF